MILRWMCGLHFLSGTVIPRQFIRHIQTLILNTCPFTRTTMSLFSKTVQQLQQQNSVSCVGIYTASQKKTSDISDTLLWNQTTRSFTCGLESVYDDRIKKWIVASPITWCKPMYYQERSQVCEKIRCVCLSVYPSLCLFAARNSASAGRVCTKFLLEFFN